MLFSKKRLSKSDFENGKEMVRIALSFAFIADTIARNTAQIPQGKAEAAKWRIIARLLDERKNEFIAGALARTGIAKGMNASVNFETGVVTEIPSKPVAEKPTTPPKQ
jgi:hypothetical protein